MKLKNITTLVFRLIGGGLLLCAATEFIFALLAAMTRNPVASRFQNGIALLIPGCCLVYFSKKLAALFCKGLDDDSK